MKESGIAVGEVPTVEFSENKKKPTGDEEEKRHHWHQFRSEVATAIKLKGGKLPKDTKLIYSGVAKLPENPQRFSQQ